MQEFKSKEIILMLRNCGKSIVIADRNERRPLNGENSGVEEETLVGEKG